MDLVIDKVSEKFIPIREIQSAESVLGIPLELAFILDPVLLEDRGEIFVVKFFQGGWLVIVDQTSTVEFLIFPLSMICDLPTGIVESPDSINFPTCPLTIVDPALT